MRDSFDNPRLFEIPKYLPVVAMIQSVVFPHVSIPILVGRKKSIKALEFALKKDKIVALITQKDKDKRSVNSSDLYTIGTAAEIRSTQKQPDGSIRCNVDAICRIKMIDFIQERPFILAKVERIKSKIFPIEDKEIDELKTLIMAQVEQIIGLGVPFPAHLTIPGMITISDLDKLTDMLAAYMLPSEKEKQIILETLDLKERLGKLSIYLDKEVKKFQVQSKIISKVQKEMGKTQRDYFLRQQLKAIQEELGEEDELTAELKELNTKIKKAKMPKNAEKKALKEIKRLKTIPPASPEYSYIRTFLDWMLDIPWSKKTRDKLDIPDAKKILDEDHYDLDKVKEHILDYLAVKKLKGKARGTILCFIGPPGTGKTSLGQSIARALNRKFIRMSLGGIRDEAEIRGHRRTYVGAMPGRIISGMAQVGTVNPVFMLDEIDKIGADFRGDPSSALLEVLDPEQNNQFRDHYLEVPYDLSNVLFITTGNILDTIPPALIDRMETLNLPGYSREEKLHIAQKFLVPKQLKEQGIEKYKVKFSDNALYGIIEEYTAEAGVRNLERSIVTICRKIAREIVSNEEPPKRVISRNLEKYLGVPKIYPSEIEKKNMIGIATGLAWTPYGGDIILVEATLFPGDGKITLTGQLGDVMQESAKASLSYIRSRAEKLKIDNKKFKDFDLHLHIPAGAIPKDGPSAGITMATAMASIFQNRSVKHDVGMTGEITLRGRVLPIGGLKSKILAAQRAGLKIVILPEKNKKDLKDIPKSVKKALDIKFVNNVDEVFDIAIEKEKVIKKKPVTEKAKYISA
ncbi:MAG: endopeptidase La [Actinobacteria bacterium]|nr:endopeptidase La [Actinomycetota bacterium]